jgi:hypothetical protein
MRLIIGTGHLYSWFLLRMADTHYSWSTTCLFAPSTYYFMGEYVLTYNQIVAQVPYNQISYGSFFYIFTATSWASFIQNMGC